MIKVCNQYFPGRLFVLLFTENALILAGIWAAVAFHVGSLHAALATSPMLIAKSLMITAVCQICFYYADIYDLRTANSKPEVVIRLLEASGAAAMILAATFYLFPEMRLGAGIVETSLLGIIFIILTWRMFVEWVNRSYSAGEQILLVGSGTALVNLARELRLRPDLPIKISGSVAEEGVIGSAEMLGVPQVGTLEDLERVLDETKPDRLIIGLQERRRQLPLKLLLKRRLEGLIIEDANALFEKITGRIPVESILPSSLIFSDGFRQSTWRRIYGRISGLLAASVLLVLCGPVMLLLAAIIKLDSRGPVLYKQQRVGRYGRNFYVLKFRSMRADAEKMSGPVWSQEEDPRITRVGKWIRKLRLDELPQLINVLKGEMSLVGPRPERPYFVQLLSEQIPFYELRHAVRPGITGWAQVRHEYGSSIDDSKAKLEYDMFYIKNISISLDLLILFQTIKTVIFGKGR
jgi:sugar transferase (PEP-CTERM system associated)